MKPWQVLGPICLKVFIQKFIQRYMQMLKQASMQASIQFSMRVFLCICVCVLPLQQVWSQDLEDSIEDELDAGTGETPAKKDDGQAPSSREDADPEEDEFDALLDEGDEEDEAPADESAENSAEKVAEKPAENSTEKTTEKTTAAQKPTAEESKPQTTGKSATTSKQREPEKPDAGIQGGNESQQAAETEADDDSTDENTIETTVEGAGEQEEEIDDNAVATEVESKASTEPTPLAAKEDKKTIFAETLGGFDDRVDPDFEGRMYNIFAKPQSLSDAKWSAMLGAHSAEKYRVQQGDSLWDISRTMFGDGFFWPKLWAENSGVSNPHDIGVGQSVVFIAGTEESAPAVAVAVESNLDQAVKTAQLNVGSTVTDMQTPIFSAEQDDSSEDAIAASTVLEEQPIVGGRPDIPPPLSRHRSVLRKLPPSFLMPVTPKIDSMFDGTGLDIGKRKATDENAAVYINSYLAEDDPPSIGSVVEIETQERTVGYLQHLYVIGQRQLNVGDKLSAVMPRKDAYHPRSGSFGPIIEVGGSIEIIQEVDPGKKLYRAVVLQSLSPIEVGALLSEEAMPQVTYNAKGPRSDVQARIIGGEYDHKRRVLGTGSVVYLDEGSKSGLADGQVIAVRSTRGERRADSRYPNIGAPIAILKLTRVSANVATGLIVASHADVRPGDLTGGPFPHPEKPVKSLRPQARNIKEVSDVDEADAEEYIDEGE